MKGLKLLFYVLAFLLLFSLAWQNIHPLLERENSITLRFAIWKVGAWRTEPIPLYAVVVVSFLAGLVLMWGYDVLGRWRLRRRVKVLEKELRALRGQGGTEMSTSLEPLSDEGITEEAEPADGRERLSP